jgi:hypothetical protein
MFNFDPKKRKAIYNVFAIMNAVVVALVPVAVQFNFIPVEWSENIIQAGAGVLSFIGFILASKNVAKPEVTIDETLGYTPEGAVVTES